jgi:hypothetical protein
MAKNALKWPQFEQLGKKMSEKLQPALSQMAQGVDVSKLNEESILGLRIVETWLQSPCFATVKIDGTNVGVDNEGRLVGRNFEIERGASYQKVDVWDVLDGFPAKAQTLQEKLQEETQQAIAQTMLYGELVVNGKYDYNDSGVFKGWLCFGVIVRPAAADADDQQSIDRLEEDLRIAGYNSRVKEGKVLLAPNEKLFTHLISLGVPTVSDRYQPKGAGDAWSQYGALPKFPSLHALLISDWAKKFFLGPGGPLGEGLVIALGDSTVELGESTICTRGSLFKWKNSTEDLGNVPDQLREAIANIHALTPDSAKHLPSGVLEALEALLLTSTAPNPSCQKSSSKPTQKKGNGDEDVEAFAAYTSALTKVDCPEDVFVRGTQAMSTLHQSLIEDVTSDLIKDYGVGKKKAKQRATAMVNSQIGKRYGAFCRKSAKGAA